MKLLFINSIGRSKWGGGEKWMLLAANGLRSRGHDVTIACLPNSIIQSKAQEAGIPIFPICIYSDFSVLGYYSIKRFVASNKTELIIGCQNKDVRISGLVARELGFPSVIGRQGVQLLHNSRKYKYFFKPFCDGIITNTKTIKEEYDSYGWWDNDYVKVIHNGVERPEENVAPFDYSAYFRKDLNGKKPIAVISTGRLTSQKGFSYLIESARKVVEDNSHVHFFIAGKGKLEKSLKALVVKYNLDRNIFFLGFRKDVPSLLKGADVFLLPSLYEGMPNAVMEALSIGLPVICTKVNGVSELMEGGKHGIIVPPSDSDAIYAAINQMLDEGLREKFSTEGRIHVETHFTIDKMISNLEDYLSYKIEEKRDQKLYKSFLIVQTAFIGDAILATPVVEKLARFYPKAKIDVVVRKGNESLLASNPHVNNIIIFDKRKGKYKNLIKVIKEIRCTNYEVVINIQRYLTTGLITAFSKGSLKIGFDKNPLSSFFTTSVKHVMKGDGQTNHEVKRNLSLIESITDSSFQMPKLYPVKADFEKVKVDKSYYCLAPTSVWFTKQYPKDKWIHLMNNLPQESVLFLMGGPGDRKECEEIKEMSNHPNVKNLSGELSFMESAALMKGAKMNFVNDSAPLHICSAMNAPVRAMFCSTIPAFGYTPLSDDSLVLEVDEELDCRPCGLHGKKACPEGHFKCGNISTETILNSLS